MSTKSARETTVRLQALQAITHQRLKWSKRRLAREIQCSPSMLLQMLDGRRQPSVEMLRRIERAERNISFELQAEDELDELERAWLVAAVERHASEFTAKEKRRIEKSLRMK